MPSFSIISFSPVSFDVGQENVPSIRGKKQNRFRAWIAGLARDFRNFFRIKPAPPPPEDVVIPSLQPPKTTTILASPPTAETKLETLNDKWVMPPASSSVVASSPPKEPEPVYPRILNPLTSPTIQRTVVLPTATRQSTIAPYRVGEGSHIESKTVDLVVPPTRPSKSKVASTINTLMLLLEIERQI